MATSIETKNAADLDAQCRQWQSRCAELTSERDRLRADLAKSQAEREAYLHAVYACLRKDYSAPTFTRDEVFAAIEHEPSLRDLIAELKREFGQET
ncbi:MAG: hypothetical protein HYX68_21575 [Planctomycetes bacterium]|nr:hypothetical protein [Planctomycetota bacterium]